MKRKIILAIADGAGDRRCEELGWKTPLEYASTPVLDGLAAQGVTGTIDIYSPGIHAATDVGHMLILGYDLPAYPGRGLGVNVFAVITVV